MSETETNPSSILLADEVAAARGKVRLTAIDGDSITGIVVQLTFKGHRIIQSDDGDGVMRVEGEEMVCMAPSDARQLLSELTDALVSAVTVTVLERHGVDDYNEDDLP